MSCGKTNEQGGQTDMESVKVETLIVKWNLTVMLIIKMGFHIGRFSSIA